MGETPVFRTVDSRTGETKELVYYAPDYVEERLREAGMVIQMLPKSGCFPSSYRSFWPAIVHSYEDAYGWTEADPPKYRPTLDQMNRFYEVLEWLPLLAKRVSMQRPARVVALRMLSHPDTGNPVHSWRRIATILGRMSKDTAKSEYLDGIRTLAANLTDRANPL